MKPWPIVPLGEIIREVEAGVSVNGEDEPVSCLSEKGVMKVSCVSDGRFIYAENKRVIAEDVSRVAVSPRKGDIVISRANTLSLVGASGLVEETHPNLFLSDKLWRAILADPEKDDPQWLIAVLNSSGVRKELARRATGTSGSMKNISKGAFLQIEVPRPPAGIQARLGYLFSQFGRIASQLERLVEAKRGFKHGIVQQLLAGTKRFPEFVESTATQTGVFRQLPADWQIVRIGDIAAESSARGEVEGAIVYSCTKHDGLVPSLEYFGKQVFSRNLDAYKRLNVGDFAYATNHIEEGSIGLLRKGNKPGLVSPMYTVFHCNKLVIPEFLFAVLKTENYRRVFESRMSASVDRRGSLRWKEFSKIRVPLPSLQEQDRIVKTLDLLDSEISMLDRQRELFHQYKRGLLARLLVGELAVQS